MIDGNRNIKNGLEVFFIVRITLITIATNMNTLFDIQARTVGNNYHGN